MPWHSLKKYSGVGPMKHAPSDDLADRYLLDDLSGAKQTGARLNGILVKIDARNPISEWSLQFLTSNRLESLAALACGELEWEAYVQRAGEEQVERVAQALAMGQKSAAEAAEREQALAAAVSANFAALERDPSLRRRRESKELRRRFGMGYIEPDDYHRVMQVLRQLANKQRINTDDIVWLQTEAHYCWTPELREAWHASEAAALTKAWQESEDAWDAVNASSHWRKAGEPERALDLTKAASERCGPTSKLQAALATTRGGAMRDLRHFGDAQSLALKAHELAPDDYRPCTLLGAVHMELGNFGLAQQWFSTAEDLGASMPSIEREIQTLILRCSIQDQNRIRAELLAWDPERFSGLIRWSRKQAPARNLNTTHVVNSTATSVKAMSSHDHRT